MERLEYPLSSGFEGRCVEEEEEEVKAEGARCGKVDVIGGGMNFFESW